MTTLAQRRRSQHYRCPVPQVYPSLSKPKMRDYQTCLAIVREKRELAQEERRIERIMYACESLTRDYGVGVFPTGDEGIQPRGTWMLCQALRPDELVVVLRGVGFPHPKMLANMKLTARHRILINIHDLWDYAGRLEAA